MFTVYFYIAKVIWVVS